MDVWGIWVLIAAFAVLAAVVIVLVRVTDAPDAGAGSPGEGQRRGLAVEEPEETAVGARSALRHRLLSDAEDSARVSGLAASLLTAASAGELRDVYAMLEDGDRRLPAVEDALRGVTERFRNLQETGPVWLRDACAARREWLEDIESYFTTLKPCPLRFFEDTHEYWDPADGRLYSGITGRIRSRLCPDEYRHVPEDVLAAARAGGVRAHDGCQLWDETGIYDGSREVADYIRLCRERGLRHMCSEWLVSDRNTYGIYASRIDKVFHAGRDKVVIADIKRTCKVNIPYVTAQVNVYKMLLELENPGVEVVGLVCIHLTKSCSAEPSEVIDLEMWDKDYVSALLYGTV